MASAPAAELLAPGWSLRARIVGWILLAGWLTLTALALFAGPRPASLDTLRAGLAAGDVDTIQVRGGLPDGAGITGYSDLQIRWCDGFTVRQVEIREARPVTDEARDTDLEVVPAGAVARLRADYPSLTVERIPGSYAASLTVSLLDRQLLGWQAAPALLLGVATLALLIAGPEPLRATRWAWFWLGGIAAPLGIIAYLVAGGPADPLRAGRRPSRRLTGGWAFLLSLAVGGSLSMLGAIL